MSGASRSGLLAPSDSIVFGDNESVASGVRDRSQPEIVERRRRERHLRLPHSGRERTGHAALADAQADFTHDALTSTLDALSKAELSNGTTTRSSPFQTLGRRWRRDCIISELCGLRILSDSAHCPITVKLPGSAASVPRCRDVYGYAPSPLPEKQCGVTCANSPDSGPRESDDQDPQPVKSPWYCTFAPAVRKRNEHYGNFSPLRTGSFVQCLHEGVLSVAVEKERDLCCDFIADVEQLPAR